MEDPSQLAFESILAVLPDIFKQKYKLLRSNRPQAKFRFKSDSNSFLIKFVVGFNRNRRDDTNSNKNMIEKVDLH